MTSLQQANYDGDIEAELAGLGVGKINRTEKWTRDLSLDTNNKVTRYKNGCQG